MTDIIVTINPTAAPIAINAEFASPIAISNVGVRLPGIKGEKGDQGLQGDIGPKGDTGETGEQGEQGAKGDTPTSFPAAGVVEDEGHVFLTANQKSDLLSFKENFVHNQLLAADTWNITHNLGKYPSVTVVDSAGTVVIGEIEYTDLNSIRIMFAAEFSGKTYFN